MIVIFRHDIFKVIILHRFVLPAFFVFINIEFYFFRELLARVGDVNNKLPAVFFFNIFIIEHKFVHRNLVKSRNNARHHGRAS